MDKLFPAHLSLIGRAGFAALLLALVLAPGIGGYPPGATYGYDIPLDALRALVAVAALCVTIAPPAPSGGALRAGASVPLDRVSLIATAFLALWTTLSLLVHSHTLTSPTYLFVMLPATVHWVCCALIFVTCARLVAADRATLLPLTAALTVGAAWTAIAGVREYGDYMQMREPAQRVSATFFDPNYAAGFLALALPVLAAAYCAARERLLVLALGVCAALAAATLVATGSRAGLGIAVAALAVTLLLALRAVGPRALPWPRIGILLVAVAALGFAFRGPLTTRVGGEAGAAQSHSNAFRVLTWKGTLAMAKANPIFGAGPGTYPDRYPPYALVEKTDLAHESYLQLAAEQGFPALLAALVAIAAALLAGLRSVLAPRDADSEEVMPRLLLCGLIGAVVAGAARSFVDSEWVILGNALPFWAVVGMNLSPQPPLRSGEGEPEQRASGHHSPSPLRRGGWGERSTLAFTSLLTLAISLLLLHNAQTVDAASVAIHAHQPPPSDAATWPPDPNLIFWTGHPDEAARIEPSSKRYFQWARTLERAGDETGAAPLFQQAERLDPNNFQTLRALAESQEKIGDAAGALATWREMIRRFEGPAGQVRAIPELPETYPAYAYAAVAQADAQAGRTADAVAEGEKAAAIIEDYSRTPPIYQQMEVASAVMSSVDITSRRQETRDLYQQIMASLAAWEPSQSDTIKRREADTLARLDAFAKPPATAAAQP